MNSPFWDFSHPDGDPPDRLKRLLLGFHHLCHCLSIEIIPYILITFGTERVKGRAFIPRKDAV